MEAICQTIDLQIEALKIIHWLKSIKVANSRTLIFVIGEKNIPGIFLLYFRLFNTVNVQYKLIFADDWIRTSGIGATTIALIILLTQKTLNIGSNLFVTKYG